MSNSAPIETEIHRLLQTSTVEATARELFTKYNWKRLNLEDLETLFGFYLASGQTKQLIEHVIPLLSKKMKIPWGHFAEAIFQTYQDIPDKIIESLKVAASSQKLLSELSRSVQLKIQFPELNKFEKERFKSYKKKIHEKKKELLSLYELFHSQNLLEQEEKVIKQLIENFPNDEEILKRFTSFNQAKSFRLLEKTPEKIKARHIRSTPLDLETKTILKNIEDSMQEILLQTPQLRADFAVAQLVLGNPLAALNLLNRTENSNVTTSEKWLKFEVLFSARKFVDLLQQLDNFENQVAFNPDTAIALIYLKALCFWEMGDKAHALDILEKISIEFPEYRNCETLLAEWKSKLS